MTTQCDYSPGRCWFLQAWTVALAVEENQEVRELWGPHTQQQMGPGKTRVQTTSPKMPGTSPRSHKPGWMLTGLSLCGSGKEAIIICVVWRGVPICVVSSCQSQHTNKWSMSKHGETELLSSEDLYTKPAGGGGCLGMGMPPPNLHSHPLCDTDTKLICPTGALSLLTGPLPRVQSGLINPQPRQPRPLRLCQHPLL